MTWVSSLASMSVSRNSDDWPELMCAGAGIMTCAQYPGSLEHEETDAADFASWGVDCLSTLDALVICLSQC